MASSTLLFDQRTRTWSDELLQISGIDRRLLCDPQPSGTRLGQVHAQAANLTGLPQGTPVVLGGHDFLCGALPAGAFQPGVLLTVLGTWDIILAALPKPILTPEVGRMGAWIDSHVARDTWAVIGTTVAGEATEWFRREFGFQEKTQAETQGGSDWDYLMQTAEASPPGAHGLLFLPHICGSTFPIVDPNSLGAFIGLRNTTAKGDMLRAVFEGLNGQFLQMLNQLKSTLGLEPQKIVAVGGGTKNRFAMQNKADLTGLPLEAPDLEEATPLGAAILAGMGVGLYQDEQDAFAQVHRPGPVYVPNPTLHEFYQHRFRIFEQLYPALKEINGQIQQSNSKE
jgi:xylulokinase